MNSNATETIAVSYLNLRISMCGLLRPEISQNDKTPSFDGHIELYSESGNRKENFVGRCPVQVKGKCMSENELDKACISYSVDVDDLKIYLADGGVIYFVVGINEPTQKHQIYYKSLLPMDLREIIAGLKDSQKSKNIELDRFPQESAQIEEICRHFLFHKLYQFGRMNFCDNVKLGQSDPTKPYIIWITRTLSPLEVLLDGKPKYVYQKFDHNFFVPVQTVTLKEIGIEQTPLDVSIDDKIFFCSVNVYFHKAGKIKSITLNPGLSIQINSDANISKIKLNEKCTLSHHIENLEFMIALSRGKELKIGNLIVGSEPKIEDDLTLLEQRLNFFKRVHLLIEHLHIKKDIKVREFTDLMYQKFEFLWQIIFENKSFEDKNAQPGFCVLTIGSIKCLLFKQVQNANRVRYLNPFAQNEFKFKISRDDSNELFPSSLFVGLRKSDFLSCDNIVYPRLAEDITSVEYSDVYGEAVNNFILELLSAYDIRRDADLLNCTLQITSWLYEHNQNEIYLINRLQTIRRKRVLEPDELNKIIALRESTGKLEIRICCSILLGEELNYKCQLEKLPSEIREEFLKYPINNLIRS